MKACSIRDCKNKYYSKGYCQSHYDKNRRHGDPLFEEVIFKGLPCPIDNCNKPIINNGMCAMHDRRNKRHGDPNFINPKCNRDGKYKERHKEYVKQWKKDNKVYYNAYLASQKERVKQATPKWADLEEIKEFYMKRPAGHHVDHIIPINGDNVSGLHVINNLQYLTEAENLKKNNKF
jgi:hypothetical protein